MSATLDFAGSVWVTDGELRQSLAVTRSLGRRGVRVEVLAKRRGSLAGSSRYAAAEHVVPDVARLPADWARVVRDLMTRAGAGLLVPTSEESLGTLYREGLVGPLRVAAPPREAYELACDKGRLLALGASVGFDVPRTVEIDSPATLEALPEGTDFPALLKARRSRFFENERWQSGRVFRVDDREALLRVRGDASLRGGALVQPFVPGRGEGLFLAAERGRVVAAFAHRRLREKPPTGGVGVLLESAAADPALLEPARRLLAALDWHGVAMLEFRREPSGRAWLIELNPRLWGSLQLAIDAGADFPALILALHGGAATPPFAPRAGVRTRWTLGELDRAIILLRRADQRGQLGLNRRAALAELASSLGSGRDEVLRWDDPLPFARELRAWFAELRAPGDPT
jgi:predicted ATP-grasp superfamily ATP-dependent carboligase